MRKNCQHIDETVFAVAQARPHHGAWHPVLGGVHSCRKPNEPAAFSLGPALLLVETGVFGLGMRGRGLRGIFGADRRARKHEREKSGNGKALRGSHDGCSKGLAVNPA